MKVMKNSRSRLLETTAAIAFKLGACTLDSGQNEAELDSLRKKLDESIPPDMAQALAAARADGFRRLAGVPHNSSAGEAIVRTLRQRSGSALRVEADDLIRRYWDNPSENEILTPRDESYDPFVSEFQEVMRARTNQHEIERRVKAGEMELLTSKFGCNAEMLQRLEEIEDNIATLRWRLTEVASIIHTAGMSAAMDAERLMD